MDDWRSSSALRTIARVLDASQCCLSYWIESFSTFIVTIVQKDPLKATSFKFILNNARECEKHIAQTIEILSGKRKLSEC